MAGIGIGQDGRKAPGEEAALAEPLPSVGLLTAPISQVRTQRLQELRSGARGHACSSGTQSWPHPRPGPPGPPCPLPSCTHDRSPHDCSWSSAPPCILGAVPPGVGGGKGSARRGGDPPGSCHRLPGGRSSLRPHRPRAGGPGSSFACPDGPTWSYRSPGFHLGHSRPRLLSGSPRETPSHLCPPRGRPGSLESPGASPDTVGSHLSSPPGDPVGRPWPRTFLHTLSLLSLLRGKVTGWRPGPLNKWHKVSESLHSHVQDGTEILVACAVLGGRRFWAAVTSSAPGCAGSGGPGTGPCGPRPRGVL